MPDFTGKKILVPVTGTRTELATELENLGARVERAEFISIEPSSQSDLLAQAFESWKQGKYAWMVLSSRNAVLQLAKVAQGLGTDLSTPAGGKIAVVGKATAEVVKNHSLSIDLVPTSRQDAVGLVQLFADAPTPENTAGNNRVLIPQGNLAGEVLAKGLRRKGWHVEIVEAYQTLLGPGLNDIQLKELFSGKIDAVILTSASVAQSFVSSFRQVEAQETQASPLPDIVAIGATTAAAAQQLGLKVDEIASEPNYDGVIRALAQHWKVK